VGKIISLLIILPILIASLEYLTIKVWRSKWLSREYSLTWLDKQYLKGIRIILPILLPLLVLLRYKNLTASISAGLILWLAILSITTDLESLKIPLEPCWAIFFLGIVLLFIGGSAAGWASFAVAFITLGIAMFLSALITRGGLGTGDIRLLLASTPLATWVGYTPFLIAVFLAGIIQLPLRFLFKNKLKQLEKGFPFAPALMIGLLFSIIFFSHQNTICHEWLNGLSCN
jgi:Flp pilus assembly protein protease CpaA